MVYRGLSHQYLLSWLYIDWKQVVLVSAAQLFRDRETGNHDVAQLSVGVVAVFRTVDYGDLVIGVIQNIAAVLCIVPRPAVTVVTPSGVNSVV